MSTAAPSRAAVSIRRAKPEDAPACGQICYEAFHKISTDHNFPPDVPAPEMGVGLLTRMFSQSGVYCVVAEADGSIVGSNCLPRHLRLLQNSLSHPRKIRLSI